MIAITHGGNLGEIDAMCAPLKDAAALGDDPGTEAFFAAWKGGAERLVELADDNLGKGHALTAGEQYGRAALYYAIAERMQAHGFAQRLETYRTSLDLFARRRRLTKENCVRIEIPYGHVSLSGLFVRGEHITGRAPIVVVMNGLDSTKELLQNSVLSRMLAARGVSALFIDQPGTGEALRLHDLAALPEAELWASPVVDYLISRDDIDPDRIGALGVSLGGYYCPRAVAFEPRFACGAVWGANADWRAVQQARAKREGENPVPHYWQHVQWVFGATDRETFFETAERMHLDGVLERIRVPFLVTHGEKDRQIPLKYAQQTYDGLINSTDRALMVFTDREGGVEHSSLDNPDNAGAMISDWLAKTLGARVA